MNGILEDYGRELLAANPSDCRKLIDVLTEVTEKEGRLTSLSWIAGQVRETLLVFGIMKADPFKGEPQRGEYSRMFLNMKTKKKPGGGKVYVLTGKDGRDEIAAFDELLKAALVARYLSGGGMDKADMAGAIAAIEQFDEAEGRAE